MCDETAPRGSRNGSTTKAKKGIISRTLKKLRHKSEEPEAEVVQEVSHEEIPEEEVHVAPSEASVSADEAEDESDCEDDSIDGEHEVVESKPAPQQAPDLDESAQRLMQILKIKNPADLTDSEPEEVKQEAKKPPVRSKRRIADVEKLMKHIANQPVIKSVVIKTRPEKPNDGLKWITERPSPSGNALTNEWFNTYAPLVPPMHLMMFTDSTHYTFDEPIDYLIAWNDAHDCCGFVKNYDDATEVVPLVMRFGGFWTSEAVRRMYVGCTVRVRTYVKIKNKDDNYKPGPVIPRGADVSKLLFACIPSPSAFAIEWAVVSKPRIIRTLGVLKDNQSYEKRGTYLMGRVRDCEYGNEYDACLEKWPIPDLKKLPEVPSPVVLNYIEFKERHVLLHSKDKSLLLPEYMNSYMRTSNPADECYFFAWVDLSMAPSRSFID